MLGVRRDYDVFYDKLLAGTSGVAEIDRFDIEEFPTKFAAQIRDFDNEGFVDKKNARRMDDCLQYALVSGNKRCWTPVWTRRRSVKKT